LKKELAQAGIRTGQLENRANNLFDTAESDYAEYRYRDAAMHYQESADALPTMSAYLNLGVCYHVISKFSEAASAYFSGLDIARKKKVDEFEEAFRGNLLYLRSDGNESLELSDESSRELSEISRLKDDFLSEETDRRRNAEVEYSTSEMEEEQFKHFQRDLKIQKLLRNPMGQAFALSCIAAQHYLPRGKTDEALEYHQKALSTYRQFGHPFNKAEELNNIGEIHSLKGDFEEAARCYEESLEIHRKIGNLLGEASTLDGMGHAYEKQGEQDEALEYFEKALGIYERIGSTTNQAIHLQSIGDFHHRQGRMDEALRYYHEALRVRERMECEADQAIMLYTIGRLYKEQGKLDEAMKLLNRALEAGDHAGEAHVQCEIGEIHRLQGQPEKALEFLEAVVEATKEVGRTNLQAVATGNIGLVYAEQGQNDKALEHLERARTLYLKAYSGVSIPKEIEKKIKKLSKSDQ